MGYLETDSLLGPVAILIIIVMIIVVVVIIITIISFFNREEYTYSEESSSDEATSYSGYSYKYSSSEEEESTDPYSSTQASSHTYEKTSYYDDYRTSYTEEDTERFSKGNYINDHKDILNYNKTSKNRGKQYSSSGDLFSSKATRGSKSATSYQSQPRESYHNLTDHNQKDYASEIFESSSEDHEDNMIFFKSRNQGSMEGLSKIKNMTSIPNSGTYNPANSVSFFGYRSF